MRHDPMTQERLDVIQERADGATSGPWGCYGDGAHEVFDAGEYSDGDRGEVVAAVIDKPSDAVFIANAREDIPALLAEVARLQHFESIVSWRYGDTTDGQTRADMIDRAARAMSKHWRDMHTNEALGHQRMLAEHALHAALGTGDTTDGRTWEDMAEKAAETLYVRDFLHWNSWATEDRARLSLMADKVDQCRKWTRTREDARAALDAALGTGEGQ